jgi:hypothetical protein
MDLSAQLAAIIGPLLILVGLGTLLNRDHYRKMITAFLENAELYYFSGAMAFVIGLALVLHHNLWVADWRVAITIIGWMSLIKGTVRILVPRAGKRVANSFSESGWLLVSSAILLLAVGAWLSFNAFAALGSG